MPSWSAPRSPRSARSRRCAACTRAGFPPGRRRLRRSRRPVMSAAMGIAVADVAERERYEITVDGELAGFAEYRGHGDTRAMTHTEVLPAFEGRGLGGHLV